MSFGSAPSTPSTEPSRVLSLRVSQSAYGTAISRVWGRTRISGNLLGYYDFTARKIEHSTSTGGGKGGGGRGKVTTYSWNYSAAMAIALCSGPIVGVPRIWINKETRGIAEMGFALKTGELGQSPWAYLQAHHPEQAISYSGIAYLTADNYDLGDDPSSPNLSFEVIGERSTRHDGDAIPGDVIEDIWSDAVEALGLDVAKLNLQDFRVWCAANDFSVSLAADTQKAARDWIRMILEATLSEAVPSQGGFRVVPLGDEPVGGWNPDRTPAYTITADDLLADPAITRAQPRTCTNKITVEYADRARDYNTVPVSASDIVHVSLYGEKSETATLPCITRAAMAAAVAESKKDRALYTLAEVELRLDERYCLLEPMDLLTLTFAPLGLKDFPLRAEEITHGEDGEITVKAREWPAGVANPAIVDTQAPGGHVPNYNVSPGNANAPLMLEPPVSLAGQPELWLATSGGTNWGGAEVWVSFDDATYSKAGTITSPARHGITTSAYPLGADPDNVNTLSVDVSASGAQLLPATAEVRDLFESLCWVGNSAGGELVAYQGATLTGVGQYSLTNCRRGAYGTKRAAHAAGAQFLRIDGAQLRYPYSPDLIGKTLYIKLRSYNKFGGNLQGLDAISAYTYVVKGAPLGAVGGLVLESPFTGLTLAVKWTPYQGAKSYTVEIWHSGSLRKSVSTADARFATTVQELVSWGVGRSVELRVIAVSENGQSSEPAVLIATKPQCAVPTISVQDTSESMIVTASTSSDAAYKATRICISQAKGFDPAGVTPYYDGPQTAYLSATIAAGAWYVRVAQYDLFGPDSLNWTSEVAITITPAAKGVVRVADASSITAAPGSPPPGGDAYWAVYDNKTGKMWRWDSAAGRYTAAVSAGDIADKIQQAQISADVKWTANQVLVEPGNLVADAGFNSPAWWAWADHQTDWPAHVTISDGGQDNGQPKRFMKIDAGANFDWSSRQFSAVCNTPYRLRIRVFRSADFVGKVFCGFHVPLVAWACPGADVPSASPEWNMPALTTPHPAWTTYEGIWTTNERQSYMQARIRAEVTAGSFQCYLECVPAVGASMVVDGSIVARHLSADAVNAASVQAQKAVFDKAAATTLSALSAALGSVTSGQITFDNNEWNFIRSHSGKGIETSSAGWIIARNAATGHFFRHFNGYNPTDSWGHELIEFDPGSNTFKYVLSIKKNGIVRLNINTETNEYSFDGNVTARLFMAQSASSGQRTVMTQSGIEVFDSNNVRRVRLGVW